MVGTAEHEILRLLHQLTCVHATLVLLAMYDSYGTKVRGTDLGTIWYESLSGKLKNATLVLKSRMPTDQCALLSFLHNQLKSV
jgi:hypothetical protein